MPKISIQERDLTTVAIDNVTDNIAYIPGYAVTGPVNTPVLCYTLEEFKAMFGEKPYKFRQSHEYGDEDFSANATPTTSFILKDSYEKSYIIASEVLRNGLPVLFERAMDSDKIDAYTAKVELGALTVIAKYPGLYGTYIQCKIDDTVDNTENSGYIDFNLIIKIEKPAAEDNYELGIPLLAETTYKISTNPDSSDYYKKFESSYVTIEMDFTEDKSISDSEGFTSLDTVGLKSDDEFTPADMYKMMSGYIGADNTTVPSIFEKLEDKGDYQIKFITSGAYPTFEYKNNSITNIMLRTAGTRGDCVALIDHTNNINRALTGDTSVYKAVQYLFELNVGTVNNPEDARRYGAMFTPYASYRISTLNNITEILPGSFAYLNSLAVSTKTNANWYAVAGVTRGLVPNLLQLSQNVTGAIADAIQPIKDGISINPITNIKPYGYCIWGNRTLNKNEKGLIASSFLNVRMLANDVKKVVYTAAKKLTFELNTDVLWLNFKSEIEPTLDKMVSGNGLTGYRILRKATTKRATIEAVIRLFVVEAVEDWDITIELSDTTVTVQ